MSDIFDTLVATQPKRDIFDQLAAAKKPVTAPPVAGAPVIKQPQQPVPSPLTNMPMVGEAQLTNNPPGLPTPGVVTPEKPENWFMDTWRKGGYYPRLKSEDIHSLLFEKPYALASAIPGMDKLPEKYKRGISDFYANAQRGFVETQESLQTPEGLAVVGGTMGAGTVFPKAMPLLNRALQGYFATQAAPSMGQSAGDIVYALPGERPGAIGRGIAPALVAATMAKGAAEPGIAQDVRMRPRQEAILQRRIGEASSPMARRVMEAEQVRPGPGGIAAVPLAPITPAAVPLAPTRLEMPEPSAMDTFGANLGALIEEKLREANIKLQQENANESLRQRSATQTDVRQAPGDSGEVGARIPEPEKAPVPFKEEAPVAADAGDARARLAADDAEYKQVDQKSAELNAAGKVGSPEWLENERRREAIKNRQPGRGKGMPPGQLAAPDEQGVRYHGTSAEFDQFDLNKSKAFGASKFGHWFSGDREFASVFGDNVKAARLAIDNPKTITTAEWNDIREAHAKDGKWFTDWKQQLVSQGYDGLHVEGKPEMFAGQMMKPDDIWAAFRDDQVQVLNQKPSTGLASASEEAKPPSVVQPEIAKPTPTGVTASPTGEAQPAEPTPAKEPVRTVVHKPGEEPAPVSHPLGDILGETEPVKTEAVETLRDKLLAAKSVDELTRLMDENTAVLEKAKPKDAMWLREAADIRGTELAKQEGKGRKSSRKYSSTIEGARDIADLLESEGIKVNLSLTKAYVQTHGADTIMALRRMSALKNVITTKGGRDIDQAAQMARDRGWIPADASESDFLDALGKVQAGRNKMRAVESAENLQGKQAGEFYKAAFKRTGKTELVKPDDLAVGSTFTLKGEKFRVTKVDPDGVITVKDGRKFGIQQLRGDETFHVDAGTLAHPEVSTEFEVELDVAAGEKLDKAPVGSLDKLAGLIWDHAVSRGDTTMTAEKARIAARELAIEGYPNPQEAYDSAQAMIKDGRGAEEVYTPQGWPITHDAVAQAAVEAGAKPSVTAKPTGGELFSAKETPFNLAGETVELEPETTQTWSPEIAKTETLTQGEMFAIQKIVQEVDPGKSANAAEKQFGDPATAAKKLRNQLGVIDSDPKVAKTFVKEQRQRLKEVIALLEQRAQEAKNPAPQGEVKPVESRTPIEVANTAKQVKVIAPEGATFIRIDDAKGRKSVISIADANKGGNPMLGSDAVKITAGTKHKGQFVPMKGDVEVVERKTYGFGGSEGGGRAAAMEPEMTPVGATIQQASEIVKKHTPGLGILHDIKSGITSLILPSANSPEHLREAEALGSKLGEMNRRSEVSVTQLRKPGKQFDRLGIDRADLDPKDNAGIKFMSDMSQGRPMAAEMRPVGDMVKREFDKRLSELEKVGAEPQTIRENYFPGMWTKESRLAFNAAMEKAVKEGTIKEGLDVNTATSEQKAAIKKDVDAFLENGTTSDKDMLSYLTRRPMQGKESFRKQKVFDDILVAAEFGLRPISNNPIDLVKGKLAEMDKSIMAHSYFADLRARGKERIINPYEEVPEGWVKVNDKHGTIYGPPTVGLEEHVDKAVYDGMMGVAKGLGIEPTRPFSAGRGKLGYASTSGETVAQFATELSVLAHEIGHQLDFRYGLWDRIAGGENPSARSPVQKELRALADASWKGEAPSDYYKQKVRKKAEKMAHLLEGYIHAPEQFKSLAPTVFNTFDSFIKSKPELKALADIKPGIALKTLENEKYVGLPIIGYRIVPKATGDIINNYLSSSLYNNRYFGTLYKAWMGTANALNQSQLGLGSAFHAGFTTAEVQVSAGANVLKDVYGVLRGNRSLADLGKTTGKLVTATGRTMIEGDKILNAWRNPDGVFDPKVKQIVRATELSGGGYKMERGMMTEQSAKMTRDWFSGKKLKAAARSPVAFTELMAKPIMELLVPRQKAGVFADLAGRIIEQNPGKPLEELTPQFRQAWNRTDARLGQVRYNRLFTNNAAKNVAQGLIRAPGWSGGTIAELGGAFIDAGRFMSEWVKTGKPPENLPDRTAYALSLLITVGTVNGALTYAFTGDMPHGMDYFAFRDGGKDKKGNDTRFLLPTYMKDVLAYAHAPLGTVMVKSHPLLSMLNETIVKNKEFYGKEIRHPGDPWYEQVGETGAYVAKSFVPFWIRGAQQVSKRGGTIAEQAAPYIGIMPAPSYVVNPDAGKPKQGKPFNPTIHHKPETEAEYWKKKAKGK